MSNRRQFLICGILASIAFRAQAFAREVTPDVVIVGGGAAGLSAARALLAGGRIPLILEAAPRLGGRAYTDTSSLGLPFDAGASIVGSQAGEPILAMAKAAGFQTRSFEPAIRVFSLGEPAPESDNEALDAAIQEISDRILGAAAEDVLGSAPALPSGREPSNPWMHTADGVLTAMTDGVHLPDRSAADWSAIRRGEAARTLPEGLGTLVQRLALGVSAHVNTRVQRIVERPDRVEVETNRGTIRAQAAIVTVSAGVLASGAIGWDPALPEATQQAVRRISMGYLEKVALSLKASSPVLDLEPDSLVVTRVEVGRSHYIHARPNGLPMAIVHFGGAWARELSMAGAPAMTAAASDIFRQAFGTEALKGKLRTVATQWSTNPNTLGAVSVVRPGAAPNPRGALGAPISKRIALAGEALGHEASQSVAGAYLSGVLAAQSMLRKLRSL